MRKGGRNKYNKGGMLRGPSHEHGGIPANVRGNTPIELEGGEYIINAQTVDAVGEVFLNKLNSTATIYHQGGFQEGQLTKLGSNYKSGGKIRRNNMRRVRRRGGRPVVRRAMRRGGKPIVRGAMKRGGRPVARRAMRRGGKPVVRRMQAGGQSRISNKFTTGFGIESRRVAPPVLGRRGGRFQTGGRITCPDGSYGMDAQGNQICV